MSDLSDMKSLSAQAEAAAPRPGTMKKVGIGAAAIAIAVVALGAATRMNAGHSLDRTAADAALPTVAVVRPQAGGDGDALVLPGNVQAFNSAAIYARTNGYVRRWLADIGDHVRTGQTLAIQNLAASTARRWNTMLAKDAVSRQEADEKSGDLAAKSALAHASLANVRRLQALQGFTQLHAPFAGVVTSRAAQIGQLVVAGNAAAQPLFTISDVRRMRIYVRVPQGYSAEVRPGMAATLSLPEYPQRRFPATLVRSAQAVDAQSGAVLVELQADNPDGALKPGAFAQVAFHVGTGDGHGMTLPGSAILYGNDGPSVAVVDHGGRVTVKPVTIASDAGKTVIISQGLGGGDAVVDSPPDAIRSGDHVRVQAAAAATATGGNGTHAG